MFDLCLAMFLCIRNVSSGPQLSNKESGLNVGTSFLKDQIAFVYWFLWKLLVSNLCTMVRYLFELSCVNHRIL